MATTLCLEDSPWLACLWAKSSRPDRLAHPLLCHLLDTGLVALSLLTHPETGHLVALFADLLGLDPAHVPGIYSCLVATHDVSKASPSFQVQSASDWARVQATGFFPPPPVRINPFQHALEGYCVLGQLLERAGVLAPTQGNPRRLFRAIALGLGGHHGTFPSPSVLSPQYPEIPADPREDWQAPWCQARQTLLALLRQVFLPESLPLPCAPGNLSALAVALCGLTILCDWLASDSEVFPPYTGDPAAYLPLATERARDAVTRRQLWRYLPRPPADPAFRQIFPVLAPRPLQEAVEPTGLPDLPEQILAVLEAPMGEGKTEAALLLAERLAVRQRCRGLYVALPTMASSNQMFLRLLGYLNQRASPEAPAALLLTHSHAALSETMSRLLDAVNHETLAPEDRVVADSWLLPRKRSLLSPYGVGTVDQALLAALNTRYGALRLFGLAGKVVVIDEVHAYDVYMSTILYRLLTWLRELGASVILLSATLPRAQRAALLAAFAGRQISPPEAMGEPYPLLTLVDARRWVDQPRYLPIRTARARIVRLAFRADGEAERQANARYLLERIAAGGCACWLCNTVEEAQQCYRTLRGMVAKWPDPERPLVALLHARFPLGQRRALEEAVNRWFGPEGPRPPRAVLVATQVVEQSLDLDFDLLLTQLAPVDLLLQRIGRLYRHARDHRPLGPLPQAVVLLPPVRAGEPDLGPSGIIYHPWLLLKTLVVLNDRTLIAIPGDVRALIESVYDDQPPAPAAMAASGLIPAVFEQAWQCLQDDRSLAEDEAKRRLLGPPDPNGHFAVVANLEFRAEEEEGEEFVGRALQTRRADPTVRVVLLDRADPLLTTLSAGGEGGRPARELLEALLERSVSIQHRALVEHIRRTTSDRVRPLDNVRGLAGYHLLILDGGRYTWTVDGRTYRLQIQEDLGVVIERENR